MFYRARLYVAKSWTWCREKERKVGGTGEKMEAALREWSQRILQRSGGTESEAERKEDANSFG